MTENPKKKFRKVRSIDLSVHPELGLVALEIEHVEAKKGPPGKPEVFRCALPIEELARMLPDWQLALAQNPSQPTGPKH